MSVNVQCLQEMATCLANLKIPGLQVEVDTDLLDSLSQDGLVTKIAGYED